MSLDDVIAVMDSMFLVLPFCRAIFTIKSANKINELIASLLQVLLTFSQDLCTIRIFFIAEGQNVLIAKLHSRALE